ncbi:MAG: hypothetical protein R2695_16485 [Acidimicrobiales bacterium]
MGDQGRPQPVRRDGVSGLANVDITPELVTRLAMAYGSTLPAGSVVVTARDSSRSARMLKRAVHAGLNAAGITVQDLEVVPLPVTRFITRRPQSSARSPCGSTPAIRTR